MRAESLMARRASPDDSHPPLRVEELRPQRSFQTIEDKSNRQDWDLYVTQAAGGLPWHLSQWTEILYRTGGYETCFLMVRTEQGQVAGVLPLFFISSLLVGKTATTLPGGFCAESGEAARALVAAGRRRARVAGLQRFVIHDSRVDWQPVLHQGGLASWDGPAMSLTSHCEHEYWLVDLRPGVEALWGQLHRNVRRQVRIAQRNGLVVEVDRTGTALAEFYGVFSRFAHQAGTPVFGQYFLENVVASFPNAFNIALVRREGEVIGGYFQLEMGNTVYGLWGAALPETLELRPTYLAYWEMLRESASRGFQFLDMGRSPAASTTSRFKGQWGGVAAPVFQHMAPLSRDDSVGSATEMARPHKAGVETTMYQIDSDGKFADGRMQLMARFWPHLPYSVATYLGPKLRRHVPFA